MRRLGGRGSEASGMGRGGSRASGMGAQGRGRGGGASPMVNRQNTRLPGDGRGGSKAGSSVGRQGTVQRM